MLPRILDTRFSPLFIHVPLFRAPYVHASCEIGVGVLCGVRINPLIPFKVQSQPHLRWEILHPCIRD